LPDDPVPLWIESEPDFFCGPAVNFRRVSALSVPCLTGDNEQAFPDSLPVGPFAASIAPGEVFGIGKFAVLRGDSASDLRRRGVGIPDPRDGQRLLSAKLQTASWHLAPNPSPDYQVAVHSRGFRREVVGSDPSRRSSLAGDLHGCAPPWWDAVNTYLGWCVRARASHRMPSGDCRNAAARPAAEALVL